MNNIGWTSVTFFISGQLIKGLYSIDSSRTYDRLLENPKTCDSSELFLPENDFKTWSVVNLPKKCPGFGGVGNQTNTWNSDLIFFHMLLYRWAQYNIKIVSYT